MGASCMACSLQNEKIESNVVIYNEDYNSNKSSVSTNYSIEYEDFHEKSFTKPKTPNYGPIYLKLTKRKASYVSLQNVLNIKKMN